MSSGPGLAFASLASSSVYGNAYLISGAGSSVLIDCGLSRRGLEQGLAHLGVPPASLGAIFITHEHTDHTRSLCLKTSFAEKHRIPVFAGREVWRTFGYGYGLCAELREEVEDGDEVAVGDLRIAALDKPHDSVEPLCYRVSLATQDWHSVAVVTDLGHLPRTLGESLRGASALILESNHDVGMEQTSGRPWHLIQRVLGNLGHLSNEQAAEAALRLATPATTQITLAHLSLDCNRPDLALEAVEESLRRRGLVPSVEALPAGGISRIYHTGLGAASA